MRIVDKFSPAMRRVLARMKRMGLSPTGRKPTEPDFQQTTEALIDEWVEVNNSFHPLEALARTSVDPRRLADPELDPIVIGWFYCGKELDNGSPCDAPRNHHGDCDDQPERPRTPPVDWSGPEGSLPAGVTQCQYCCVVGEVVMGDVSDSQLYRCAGIADTMTGFCSDHGFMIPKGPTQAEKDFGKGSLLAGMIGDTPYRQTYTKVFSQSELEEASDGFMLPDLAEAAHWKREREKKLQALIAAARQVVEVHSAHYMMELELSVRAYDESR